MGWGICRCGINPIAWTEDDRFLLLRLVEVNIPTTKNVGRKDKISEAWENVAKAMFQRTGKEWAIKKLKEKYKAELKLHRQMKAKAKEKEASSNKSGGAAVSPARQHPYASLLGRSRNTANYVPRDKEIDLTGPQTYSSAVKIVNTVKPSLRTINRTGPRSKKKLSDTFKMSIDKKKTANKEGKKNKKNNADEIIGKMKIAITEAIIAARSPATQANVVVRKSKRQKVIASRKEKLCETIRKAEEELNRLVSKEGNDDAFE